MLKNIIFQNTPFPCCELCCSDVHELSAICCM